MPTAFLMCRPRTKPPVRSNKIVIKASSSGLNDDEIDTHGPGRRGARRRRSQDIAKRVDARNQAEAMIHATYGKLVEGDGATQIAGGRQDQYRNRDQRDSKKVIGGSDDTDAIKAKDRGVGPGEPASSPSRAYSEPDAERRRPRSRLMPRERIRPNRIQMTM